MSKFTLIGKSADALRQAFRSKLLRGPGSWTFSYRFPLPRELHWDTVFGRVPSASLWETASAQVRICSVSQWLSLGHGGGGQCFSQWARIAIPVAPTGNFVFSLLPVLISGNCTFPTFPKGIHWELYRKTFASEFLWELCRKTLPSGFLWEMWIANPSQWVSLGNVNCQWAPLGTSSHTTSQWIPLATSTYNLPAYC